MGAFSLDHLNDAELRRGLFHWGSQERSSTAMFIAHIAEFDRRKLYLPEGYPSMFMYCVKELKLSEGGAFRRIRTARVAREYPQIFEMLSNGSLHLTAVVLLAPHLDFMNCDELLRAASCRKASEIESLLAERFPQPDVPTRIAPLRPRPPAPPSAEAPVIAAAPVTGPIAETSKSLGSELTLTSVEKPMISHFSKTPSRPTRVAPLAPERFALHTTIDRECRDLLEEAKVLMSHAVSPGDIPEILKRGLKRLVRELRCRKLGDVSRSRPARPLAAGSRTIPAHVRRAVWRREGGQCSFVSASGHRCEARALLEFHHEIAFAQGGEATVGTISLRCRSHNYYEAEQVFGAGFMARKSRTR